MNMTYNGVKPRNKSEILIWIITIIPTSGIDQIRYWPRSLASAVITKSLNYVTRWQLLVYFVGNGMHVDVAEEEVLKMGLSYFDEQAKRHIRGLVKDIKKGRGRWEYFDEITRKREELTGFEEPKRSTRHRGPVFGEDTSDYFWNGFRLVPKEKVHVTDREEEEDEDDWY